MGAEHLNSLPLGEKHSSSNCVVANALKDLDPSIKVHKEGIFTANRDICKVIADQLEYYHELIEWKLPANYHYGVSTPSYIRIFIADFDDGKYPELEIN